MDTTVDVLGLELDEARRRLSAAGLRIGPVVETKPPRPVRLAGALRVIRMGRPDQGAVELVVTRERFEPPVVSPREPSAEPRE